MAKKNTDDNEKRPSKSGEAISNARSLATASGGVSGSSAGLGKMGAQGVAGGTAGSAGGIASAGSSAAGGASAASGVAGAAGGVAGGLGNVQSVAAVGKSLKSDKPEHISGKDKAITAGVAGARIAAGDVVGGTLQAAPMVINEAKKLNPGNWGREVGDDGKGSGGESQGEDKGQVEEGPAIDAGDVAKAGGAAMVAAPVAQMGIMMAMLSSLKAAAASAVAAVSNVFATVWAAVVGFGKGAAALVLSSMAIASGAAGLLAAVVVGAVVLAATAGSGADTAAKKDDVGYIDCDTAVQKAIAGAELSEDQISAKELEHAKTVYSVYSALGMSDENVAGLLGNWSVESGIDPTTIEGIYHEKYVHGPDGQKVESYDFVIRDLPKFPWMDYPSYSARFPLIKKVGIGLGQWTDTNDGATGNTDLRAFAEGINKNWYDLETQLAFSLSPKDQHHTDLMNYMATDIGDPEEAAWIFTRDWERNTSMGQEERKAAAAKWYVLLDSWESNATLANSLLELAGTQLDSASKSKINQAMTECVGSRANLDNSSMSTAMVSYSWPVKDDGYCNDGTYLYIWLHEEIFPGDNYFASCDRSVATGVRWSGADDTFPVGGVAEQLRYVRGEGGAKWEQVTEWTGDTSVLLPGDVFMKNGEGDGVSHIVMWVGEESIMQVWGEDAVPGTNIAHGSLPQRSPTIDQYYDSVWSGNNGLDTFSAWRLKAPDNSSTYSSLIPPASALANAAPLRWTTPGAGFCNETGTYGPRVNSTTGRTLSSNPGVSGENMDRGE